MKRLIDRYLNEIVGLTVMLLMFVALVHAEAVVRPASGEASGGNFTTIAGEHPATR